MAAAKKFSRCNSISEVRRHPRLSSALAQADERIEDQSIEGQALAKRTFAEAKCPLRRDAYFVDAGLPRRRLDPVNQLRHLPIEDIRYPEEVGPKGDEQVAVVALLLRARPGEQSQRLYHQRQPEAFVAAERKQCAAACKRRVPGRLAVGPDRHAFGKQLVQPFA